MSAELRRELRQVVRERDAIRDRLLKLECSMPKRPIDPSTGRPGSYRSRAFRIADRAIQLCHQALGSRDDRHAD